MDKVVLQNEWLTAIISPAGAELQSLRSAAGVEYMWQAGEAWPKYSPVLFPIVGTLVNNRYLFGGNTYALPRHGFAREKIFEVENATADAVSFCLTSSDDTLKVYPFEFAFYLHYRLVENRLSVEYEIVNRGRSRMWFSVGGHPAFSVPVNAEGRYEDYYLQFNADEVIEIHPLLNGLLKNEIRAISLDSERRLWLTKELFAGDALVSTSHKSRSVVLGSHLHHHKLALHFKDFPHLGIWAGNGGDFVCIEPWQGHADWVDAPEALEAKSQMSLLEAHATRKLQWSVTVENS